MKLNTALLKYAINVLTNLNIQCHKISLPFNDTYEIDYQIHHNYISNAFYDSFSNYIENNLKLSTLLYITDGLSLEYAVFFTSETKNECYVLGPIHYDLKEAEIENLLRNVLNFQEQQINTFMELYTQVPHFSSSNQFFALLTSLFSPVFYDDLFTDTFTITETFSEQLSIPHALIPTSTGEYSIVQQRYDAENRFTNAVSIGNIHDAIYHYSIFRQFYISPRAAVPLRHVKNMFIVMNTVLRKAIEKADIHPFYIEKLSKEISIYIESCTNIQQLESYSHNVMIRKYCLLVQNHSLKGYSKTVKACISYIDFHYKEELSLNKIATALFMNASYISSTFHKETDMTITDYIYKVRLKEAILLLNSSNMAITDISSQCGFSDLNYFTRIFKKYHQMTPTQYRKFIQR